MKKTQQYEEKAIRLKTYVLRIKLKVDDEIISEDNIRLFSRNYGVNPGNRCHAKDTEEEIARADFKRLALEQFSKVTKGSYFKAPNTTLVFRELNDLEFKLNDDYFNLKFNTYEDGKLVKVEYVGVFAEETEIYYV